MKMAPFGGNLSHVGYKYTHYVAGVQYLAYTYHLFAKYERTPNI